MSTKVENGADLRHEHEPTGVAGSKVRGASTQPLWTHHTRKPKLLMGVCALGQSERRALTPTSPHWLHDVLSSRWNESSSSYMRDELGLDSLARPTANAPDNFAVIPKDMIHDDRRRVDGESRRLGPVSPLVQPSCWVEDYADVVDDDMAARQTVYLRVRRGSIPSTSQMA